MVIPKEYEKALKDSQRASSLDATLPLPYYRRGSIYQALGKKAEAIDSYQRFSVFPADESLKESARQEIAKLRGQ